MAGHKVFVNPGLYDGLPGDIELARLPVQTLDHPVGKIDVDPLDDRRVLKVEVTRNVLAAVEFFIEFSRCDLLSS